MISKSKPNKISHKNLQLLRVKANQALKNTRQSAVDQKATDVYKLLHELEVHQIELELQNDELQRTLLELSQTQKKYQDLYEFSPIGYLTLDENNLIVGANLTFSALVNCERKLLLNKRFSSFISKDTQSIFYKHREKVLSSKAQHACEVKLIRKDGTPFYAHLQSIIAKDDTHFKHLSIAIVDMSERKKFEKALQDSEEKFRSFVENTKEWVWEIDAQGCFKYCNPSIMSILGYHPHELLKKNRLIFVYAEERKYLSEKFMQCIRLHQGWSELILRWVHKDGTVRYLESNATPVYDNEGAIQGFRGADRDITLRKKSEEQIRQYELALNQAARTRSIGELASALAHELTQPLTAINSFTTGCVHRLENGDYKSKELLDMMKHVEKLTVTAGAIVHRMKDFMRQGKLYYDNIDLNELIMNTVAIFKNEVCSKNIKIQINIVQPPLFIKGDNIQLGLVLLNLLRNSAEAMLKTSHALNVKANSSHVIVIQIKRVPKNRVLVSVRDTGPGIQKDIVEKIFAPCFTTKCDSLGVGLAIARTIVEAHQGHLYAKIDEGMGACFEMNLPIK